MKQPKYLNEWVNELLSKINTNDKSTSQICAFMLGLSLCALDGIKSIDLCWKEHGYNVQHTVKPHIKVEFK